MHFTNKDGEEKTLAEILADLDWKLWELYQTAQRVEKHLGIDKDDKE